jgi:CarD family transcriptional regulator, regulator of rRNA transcription
MATKSQEPVIGDGSLHIGDRVVYPNQGICRITGVETKHIAGQNWEVVTLSREEDGATVMVPKAKVMGIGLRKVADVAAIDRVFDELSTPNLDPQLDWKVRHRENADRMTGGGLFGTVEVLKGLHALSRVRPLPQKERELYDNARHLLVGEIAAAMNIPLHVAEDNLDYALWPPEGMTRKGKALPPATLGPPSPARSAADDLGFDDEELGAEETTATATTAAPAAAESNDDEEKKEEAAPTAKKAAAEKTKPAHKPEHAPTRREKPAPAAAKKAKPAHAPAKKPAAAKKAPARKPAPKAPARKPSAKRPVAKAKAKAKR